MPQQRLLSNKPIAAATTDAAITFDVSGVSSLTLMGYLTPQAGTFVSGDAGLFVRAMQDSDGKVSLIPPVRSLNDNPGATDAGVIAQYDVRGLKRVAISLRNNNATNAANGFLDAFTNPRGQAY